MKRSINEKNDRSCSKSPKKNGCLCHSHSPEKIHSSKTSVNFYLPTSRFIKQKDTMTKINLSIVKEDSLEKEQNYYHFNIESSEPLEENKENTYNRDLQEINFCIGIDGSHHCEYAFDILAKEFFTKSSKVVMTYIYHSQLNNEFNYQNRRETVIDIYQTKAIRLNSKSLFLNEDSNSAHFIHQVYNIAKSYKSDYFILGLNGLEGPKRDKKVLFKGLNFILKDVRIPSIIVQCKSSRSANKSFNWMFIIDSLNHNSLKIFPTFLPLVRENDYIYCINLIPRELKKDNFEEDFYKNVSYYKIKKFEYSTKIVINMEESIREIVDLVNFSNIDFNFTAYHHNSEKILYNSEINDNLTYKLIKKIRSNVCLTY